MISKREKFVVGKIPPEIMSRVIYRRLGKSDRRVITGPGIGRDSAAVKYDGKALVFTSDPVTGTPSNIGQHSVIVNANDVAVAGARPRWYLCTILLPIGSQKSELDKIATEIHAAAIKLGVSVIGGHTETTPGINRPIISGFMIGETAGRLFTVGNSRQGDIVLMTQTAGLEGTAILARDQASLLRTKGVPQSVVRTARGYAKRMSVVGAAIQTAKLDGVHALHDPTEGGVLNGLWEIAVASELGIEVLADNIPISSVTRRICLALRLDPLKLMSSGSLMVVVERSRSGSVQSALSRIGVKSTAVATMTHRARGKSFLKNNRRRPLRAVSQDELYRV